MHQADNRRRLEERRAQYKEKVVYRGHSSLLPGWTFYHKGKGIFSFQTEQHKVM